MIEVDVPAGPPVNRGAYRVTAELDRGDQPWSELYEFRNILAHWTPGQANTARVWHESARDLPRVIDEVRSARTR